MVMRRLIGCKRVLLELGEPKVTLLFPETDGVRTDYLPVKIPSLSGAASLTSIAGYCTASSAYL